MFLAKRSNGIFFVEFFDEKSQKIRRKSLGTKDKSEAYFLSTKFSQGPVISHTEEKLSRVIIIPSWGHKVSPPKILFSVSVN